MPRLRIIYDVDGWAFHRRALALQAYAPAEYEVTVGAWSDREGDEPDLGDTRPDVVYCMPSSRLGRLRVALDRHGWDSVVVGSWTTGWPLWISRFHEVYRHADLLIVNNHDAWARMGKLPGTVMIPNGVDLRVFQLTAPITDREPRVLWTGSIFHSGAKCYHSHVLPLMKRLDRSGVAVEVLRVDSYDESIRAPDEMASWYNRGTVLVCASELEGTPNPCLEAAACGCTLVSTRVGNMPELIDHDVNGYLVERSVNALHDGVRKALDQYERLATRMQEDIRAWSYDARASEFYTAFDRALADSRKESGAVAPQRAANGSAASPGAAVRADAAQPDLRGEVTAFVSTVGAPSYPACHLHLRLQDCLFDVQVIENVAPMSAAFQQMIDRCDTPYYVQVDEDMLLYPHAIRHLHSWLSSAGDHVAGCAGLLLDAHLRRTIIGVKIFRHEIVRRFPLGDVEAAETEQVHRMAEAGFPLLTEPIGDPTGYERALGLHGTHWTPRSIFERYATLERKRRRDPSRRLWVAECAPVFLERYLRSRGVLAEVARSRTPRSARIRLEREAELDLYAVLGSLSGSLSEVDGSGSVKDFRTYAELPEFELVRDLVQKLGSGDGPDSTTDTTGAQAVSDRGDP